MGSVVSLARGHRREPLGVHTVGDHVNRFAAALAKENLLDRLRPCKQCRGLSQNEGLGPAKRKRVVLVQRLRGVDYQGRSREEQSTNQGQLEREQTERLGVDDDDVRLVLAEVGDDARTQQEQLESLRAPRLPVQQRAACAQDVLVAVVALAACIVKVFGPVGWCEQELSLSGQPRHRRRLLAVCSVTEEMRDLADSQSREAHVCFVSLSSNWISCAGSTKAKNRS